MGCNDPIGHQTAQQIADRVLIKGFKCEIKLSDHVLEASHSHFGDDKKRDKKRAFMNKKLTGNLGDFTGIGPATLKNLAKVGITNSDGLFAAFLSIIDNPNPMANTDKCGQFYEQLGKWKVASGYKATIVYQLQSKLAVGIDSSNVGIEHCQLWTLDFVNKPLLTGELNEVPGLGEVCINTLNRSGIFTTYQLIGKFLEVRKRGSNRA
jgi:predicted flap endonuclease-1-like 5' DNA nuclease